MVLEHKDILTSLVVREAPIKKNTKHDHSSVVRKPQRSEQMGESSPQMPSGTALWEVLATSRGGDRTSWAHSEHLVLTGNKDVAQINDGDMSEGHRNQLEIQTI